jgi:ATP-dependent DNA ligase
LAVQREHQPTFISPMLLTSGALPGGEGWSLEIKWDGCRAELRYDSRSVCSSYRTGRGCSRDFPELTEIAGVLGDRRATLDGELVCLREDGRPDFALLRQRLGGNARSSCRATWIKQKLRRDECLAVTGVWRNTEGIAEAVFVARPLPDGSVMSAGSIELGLGRELIDQLEDRLAELPPRRRGPVSWYPAEVSVIASVHGLPDGPVRDAILRQVVHT